MAMKHYRRILFLIGLMAVVVASVVALTLNLLYQATLQEQRASLIEAAHAEVVLIQTLAELGAFEGSQTNGGEIPAYALNKINQIDARGAGVSGTLVLGRREGDQIIFLNVHGESGIQSIEPIPAHSELGAPMRLALAGQSGTTIGLDYHGKRVLAAYEPIEELGLGVVAKIDLIELQAPYIQAGALAGVSALVLILGGSALFWRAGVPLVRELEISEEKYRALFEHAPLGIALTTLEGKPLAWNQSILKLHGYADDEYRQLADVRQLYANPDDRTRLIGLMQEHGRIRNYEADLRRKDGSIFPASLTTTLSEVGGEPVIFSMVQDISERKEADEILRKLFYAVEQSPNSIVITNTDGSIEYVNPRFTQVTGYSFGEVIGQNPRILKSGHTSPDGYKEMWETITAGKEWRGVFLNRKKNGDLFWESASIGPIRNGQGEITHFVAVKEDISGLKQVQDELRASEERFRRTVELAGAGITHVTPDGRFRLVNDRFCQITGYSREEILGLSVKDITHPDDMEADGQYVRQVEKGDTTTRSLEKRYIRKDGETVWVNLILSAIRNARGEPESFIGIVEDISERKRMETALREAETRYRRLFEDVPVGLYRTTPSGEILDANQALVELLGYPDRESLLGDNAKDIVLDSREQESRLFETNDVIRDFEIHMRRYNGTPIWVMDTVRAVVDADDESRLLREIAQIIVGTGGYRRAWIGFADHGLKKIVTPIAWAGYENGFMQHLDLSWANDAGVAGQAIRSGQAALTREASGDPAFQPWEAEAGQPQRVWALALPLAGDVAFGLQMIYVRKAPEQARSAEHEQRLFAETLAASAAALNRTLHMDAVIDRLLDHVKQVVPYEAASVMLVEDKVVRTRRARGYEAFGLSEWINHLEYDVTQQPAIRNLVEVNQPVILDDLNEEMAQLLDLPPEMASLHSLVSLPIITQGQLIGVLNLAHTKRGHFTIGHAERLQAFADQAASAIINARLFKELEHYSEYLQEAVEGRTAELRHVKERVEAVLNNSPDAILMLDRKGRIQVGNPAFQSLFRQSVDAIFGSQIADICAPEQAEKVQQAARVVAEEGRSQRLTLSARRMDGTLFDADIALAPLHTGEEISGIVCSVRDISAFKEVERMKDQFVSNVSHELRTPITGLKLNYRLIQMDPERQDTYVQRLGREIDRLNGLIEDLLRLSRLDQGRVALNMERLDLNELGRQYVEDRGPLAEDRQISLNFKGKTRLPEVQADKGLLGQAISVLLTNALNYTPGSGQVAIQTRTRKRDGQQWAGIAVSDTGPGIGADEIGHLLQRFFRGKTGRDSGVPGTGLGLAIAHEIVERHQGRIEVESAGVPGEGTTFTIWLPAAGESDVQS